MAVNRPFNTYLAGLTADQRDNFQDEISAGQNSNGTVPEVGGFFADDDPTTKIHRFRDRVLFGDAVKYTGRRTAPLGGDWLTENAHSYPMKNVQVAILGDETEKRYGLLVAVRGGGVGVFAEVLNEDGAAGRAIYAEAKHKGTAVASSSIEIAAVNYTTTNTVPSPYSMSGVRGLFMGAYDGAIETAGDDNHLAGTSTYPSAAAIDIAGNPTSTAARWNKGLIFRDSSLYRDTDGLTGKATAIEMAQQHQIRWWASNTVIGATIRSDVTATASNDVGVYFSNNVIKLAGTGEAAIAQLTHVASGVNYVGLQNAGTGGAAQISALGSDANVSLDFVTKGSGAFNFGDDTGASRLRIDPGSSLVNLSAFGTDTNITISQTAKGSGVHLFTTAGASDLRITTNGSGVVTLSGTGGDTNIDLALTPKGTGNVRFGTHAAIAAETVTGYITIKDASGTTRKLAVVS